MLVAGASYGLAAVAFAVLAWESRRRGAPRHPMFYPALVSSLWAALAAAQVWLGVASGLVALAEAGRSLAWVWLLWLNITRLRGAETIDTLGLSALKRGLLIFAAVLLLAQMLALLGGYVRHLAQEILPALLSIAGMVLVEQFYRNSRAQERWGIKFLCLALGGLFAYDFYLYSEAMLFAEVSPDSWAARGAVNALLTPFLWLSLRRQPANRPLAISHRMAFHSVTLIGAGVYLLLMAAAGYYLRIVGGSWGAVLQTVFLVGALVLLLVTVFSGVARARLRVFLSKHFFHYRYDYREEWLRFTSLLTEGEPGVHIRERSLEAMARLVASPAAILLLKQEDGSFRRSAHWNWADLNGQLPADHPFIRFLEARQWVIDLHESESQQEQMDGVAPPAWLSGSARAWLVVPLFWHDRMLGIMVLADSLGKIKFDWETCDLLKTAARQAAAHLAQARASEALTVARQFESFNRAAAFVVHDIKNLVAQLSLLLANAERHKYKPAFQEDMLATIDSSVARMNRMLVKLRDKPDASNAGMVDLEAMLKEVMQSKSAYSLKPTLEILTPGLGIRADLEKLSRVVGHIVQNAIEATPYQGKVGVTLAAREDHAEIVVADTGAGMDEAFIRDRLFSPFDSTKGTGMGIGAYECKSYVQELGGDISVESRPGFGSRFTLSFPLQS